MLFLLFACVIYHLSSSAVLCLISSSRVLSCILYHLLFKIYHLSPITFNLSSIMYIGPGFVLLVACMYFNHPLQFYVACRTSSFSSLSSLFSLSFLSFLYLLSLLSLLFLSSLLSSLPSLSSFNVRISG